MKAILLSVILMIIAFPFEIQAQNKRNEVKYENTEWTNVWLLSCFK